MVQQGWKAAVAATEAQQESVNSLAEINLQNHRALDLLTPENGGTCALINETCCLWINNSHQVEEGLKIKKENTRIIDNIHEQAGLEPSWLQSPL